MKLGPSLIGAVVGGLVGVAAQIGLESSMGKEAVWFALVVGLFTGLGARIMAGDGMRQGSFIRAGLVAFIALAAIFGASMTSAKLTRQRSLEAYQSKPTAPPRDQDKADQAEESETDETATEPDDETTEPAETGAEDTTDEPSDEEPADEPADEAAADDEPADDEATEPAQPPKPVDLSKFEAKDTPKQKLDVLQLVFVVVGTLLAYELSRGGGKKQHA